MKKLLTVFLLLLAVAAFASADIYIKTKTHTDPMSMMGQTQPAKDEIMEQWFEGDRFAMIGPAISIIVDLKKNALTWVQHQDKTYVETTLPLDFAKLVDPQAAQMMGQMMKMTVSVTPTGQTKTIGQWKCSGYDVSLNMMMMPMKMSAWATTDLPFDLDKFMNLYTNVLKAQMQLDDAALQEFKKIKGYMIASDMSAEMMGAKIHVTTEVQEISKKTPPTSVYSVPAGYTKKDKLSMMDLRNR